MGFTVVEMLIAVSVIAILAGIVTVGYRGVQDRGHDTAVQSDLTKLADAANLQFVETKYYPGVGYGIAVLASETKLSTKSYYDSSSLQYCEGTTAQSVMGITARSKSGNIFYITSDEPVKKQSGGSLNCGSHLDGIPAGDITTSNITP